MISPIWSKDKAVDLVLPFAHGLGDDQCSKQVHDITEFIVKLQPPVASDIVPIDQQPWMCYDGPT
jgi:hypothetical protein